MENRIYTIPRMGYYSDILVKTLKELGLNIISPVQMSNASNNEGIKTSSEMMCWSYKCSLGSIIETIKKHPEITDIIIYSTEGTCRYRHFGKLYDLALSNLNHNINVHIIKRGRVIRDLKKITGASYFKLWRTLKKVAKEVKEYESKQNLIYSKGDIKILIIGEIYVLLEPKVSFHLKNKLFKMGALSIQPVNLSSFISHDLFGKEIYHKEVKKYLNGEVGGHGKQNIIHVLDHINNVDGIIYCMPLSCCPEQTVTPIIEHICRKFRLPILKVELDENAAELNIQTRIEAFIDTIRRNKQNLEK